MGGPTQARVRSGCTLSQRAEYNRTVHVRRRCGPTSNYSDHALLLFLHACFCEYIFPGAPCLPEFDQLSATNGEMEDCTRVKSFDYFSGSETAYVLTVFFILGSTIRTLSCFLPPSPRRTRCVYNTARDLVPVSIAPIAEIPMCRLALCCLGQYAEVVGY